jgi:hypothetical protein
MHPAGLLRARPGRATCGFLILADRELHSALGDLLHRVQHVAAGRDHASDLVGLAPRSVSSEYCAFVGSAWRVFPVGDSFLCAGADEPRGASFRSSRTAFDELLIDDRAHDELRERIRTIPALHGQALKAAPIALARAAGRMVEQHTRARHSWRELATMARAICRDFERLPLGFRSKLLYT